MGRSVEENWHRVTKTNFQKQEPAKVFNLFNQGPVSFWFNTTFTSITQTDNTNLKRTTATQMKRNDKTDLASAGIQQLEEPYKSE
jgi:hypothetical protein